ncbi:hypothetical protein [Ornithinimicrobium kibberense]|uniref:hypothetical protein n=1 Tax=Ornithinimicrobium kibberense TaxID=282060 RepID=UPI00361BB284
MVGLIGPVQKLHLAVVRGHRQGWEKEHAQVQGVGRADRHVDVVTCRWAEGVDEERTRGGFKHRCAPAPHGRRGGVV